MKRFCSRGVKPGFTFMKRSLPLQVTETCRKRNRGEVARQVFGEGCSRSAKCREMCSRSLNLFISKLDISNIVRGADYPVRNALD